MQAEMPKLKTNVLYTSQFSLMANAAITLMPLRRLLIQTYSLVLVPVSKLEHVIFVIRDFVAIGMWCMIVPEVNLIISE